MKIKYSLLVAAVTAAGTASTFAAEALFVDAQTVRQVQKTLSDRGYRTGGVDGRMGPQTQAALRKFQQAEKLEPSGQLNRQTLVALGVQKAGDGVSVEEQYDRVTIRKVQQTLNARGYQAGAPDGILSERTRAALREFQKSENLEDTGRLNRRTLAALGLPEDSASMGSTRGTELSRDTIQQAQRSLARRGYRPGTPDGVVGPATRAALTEFQRAENLAVTGRLNRETLAALGVSAGLAAAR